MVRGGASLFRMVNTTTHNLLKISLILLLGLGSALAAKERPGPQSIPRHSKVDLSALGALFKGSSDDNTAEKADSHGHHKATPTEEPTLLIAVIQPTEDYTASGIVFFESVEDGVKVSGRIENLAPGDHGFHVHEFGDISAADGTSAGGHFNPGGEPHASRQSEHRHVGDLGNITADEDGVAEFSFVDSELAMDGSSSIIGRGLIVHRDADDLTSQPTGAAGPRVGMAVIGVADPDTERL